MFYQWVTLNIKLNAIFPAIEESVETGFNFSFNLYQELLFLSSENGSF